MNIVIGLNRILLIKLPVVDVLDVDEGLSRQFNPSHDSSILKCKLLKATAMFALSLWNVFFFL